MQASLLFSALLGILAAALFAYVGFRLGRRVVQTPEARAAFTCFRVWWYAVAATTLVTPVRILLYMTDSLPLWLYHASANVTLVLACLALWALLCNLIYLYTGSVKAWGPLAGFYFLVGAFFLGLLAWVGFPSSITDDGWSLQTTSARPLPTMAILGSLALLLGPQLVAAFAYLRLLRVAPERTQRYRIVMVAGSIIVWFGSTIVASILDLHGAAGTLVPRAVSVLAALLVLFAYEPPRALQRRLGVQRAGEEDRAVPGAAG